MHPAVTPQSNSLSKKMILHYFKIFQMPYLKFGGTLHIVGLITIPKRELYDCCVFHSTWMIL